MTELTFTAGERATLDLRDCAGAVVIQDGSEGEEAVLRVASDADRSPFVLRDRDTFRIRLDEGGTITVPQKLPIEVVVSATVRLRLMRVGGETVVKPASPTAAAGEASGEEGAPTPPSDLSEFARVMSDYGRRIFSEMTARVRSSGADASGEAARHLDEAAERIDEQVQHVAERVEREVERALSAVERAAHRAEEHGRRAAERAQDHQRRAVERAQHHSERAGRRAGRGRWWFTERMDEFARHGAAARDEPGGGAPEGVGAPRPTVNPQERHTVLQMLAEGKITADQAATLLDALGR